MDVWMCGLVFHEIVTLRPLGDQYWAAFGQDCQVNGRPVEELKERLRQDWKQVKPPLFQAGRSGPDADARKVQEEDEYRCGFVVLLRCCWTSAWPPLFQSAGHIGCALWPFLPLA